MEGLVEVADDRENLVDRDHQVDCLRLEVLGAGIMLVEGALSSAFSFSRHPC